MRTSSVILSLLTAATAATAKSILASTPDQPANYEQQRQPVLSLEAVIMPPLPPPPPPHAAPPAAGDSPEPQHGTVVLSDVLGNDRSTNVFAGLARDIPSVADRVEDAARNTTVLSPLNSAIAAMPRKPWEDAADYEARGARAYEGGDGVDRAHDNLRRFVESHVVPESPWGRGEKSRTMAGQEVWWEEEEDGVKYVHPGKIEVASISSTVANGEVWILKGVRTIT